MTQPGSDPDPRLRALCWARLGVAGVLVAAAPWAPVVFVPTARAGLLLGVLLLVVVSSGVLLLVPRPPRPRVVAWLLCTLDAMLVTAVVAATGGARSALVFLYVLLVTGASLLLPRWGALAIAFVSGGLYTMLVLARSVVPALAFDEPLDGTAALDMLTVLVASGTIILVSAVAGGLAERFLTSQRELASERRTLGDLQAFSDVIFQSVGTGLVALDRDRRVTALNHAAVSIAGVPAPEAVGARWDGLFGADGAVDAIEAALSGASKASARREIELVRHDGTVVPVRITAWPLEAGNGARLGCIVACEDLSSARTMEARLRQAAKLATLGRMAANIAHEVRNPLAALSGAVEHLTLADVTTETRARLTGVVLRESERLSGIIGDFLDYARPAPIVIERIDASAVLDDVLRALPLRRPPGEITIVRAFPESLPLEADRGRFRQVLWTLCAHAVGAMPTGGELRVDGQARAGNVEITVADTSEGIPPQDLDHVFEPFFATRYDPTGLGLALVQRIAHEHGGDVTVRSEPGLGAEFSVRFPERHA